MTAYRQEALACAAALSAGPQRPRDLKPAAPRAPKILLHNVYGWFERTDRGVYALTDAGRQALAALAAGGLSRPSHPASVSLGQPLPEGSGDRRRLRQPLLPSGEKVARRAG